MNVTWQELRVDARYHLPLYTHPIYLLVLYWVSPQTTSTKRTARSGPWFQAILVLRIEARLAREQQLGLGGDGGRSFKPVAVRLPASSFGGWNVASQIEQGFEVDEHMQKNSKSPAFNCKKHECWDARARNRFIPSIQGSKRERILNLATRLCGHK